MRRPSEKRYSWLRIYNGFWDHPKWRVVARLAEAHVTHVHSIAGKLLESANRGRPRGSIADFSTLECAASLDLGPEQVKRVYGVLEEMAWIDREYLTTWDERQPDKEDPTNADRQQRYRDRKRGERNAVTPLLVTDKTQTQTSKKEEAIVTPLRPGDQTADWAKAEKFLREKRTKQREMPFFGEAKKKGDR